MRIFHPPITPDYFLRDASCFSLPDLFIDLLFFLVFYRVLVVLFNGTLLYLDIGHVHVICHSFDAVIQKMPCLSIHRRKYKAMSKAGTGGPIIAHTAASMHKAIVSDSASLSSHPPSLPL